MAHSLSEIFRPGQYAPKGGIYEAEFPDGSGATDRYRVREGYRFPPSNRSGIRFRWFAPILDDRKSKPEKDKPTRYPKPPEEKYKPQDTKNINVRKKSDIAYWCGKLGVSAERLKDVVKMVGTSVRAVKKHLGK